MLFGQCLSRHAAVNLFWGGYEWNPDEAVENDEPTAKNFNGTELVAGEIIIFASFVKKA